MKTGFWKFNILLALLVWVVAAQAETITYRITEYNSSTETFTLAPSGLKPAGSWAEFESKYGATTGNRYNQIPRNQEATLWLEGWEGCALNSVTLSMCSNNKAGTFSLVVKVGDDEAYKTRSDDFASDTWFGRWVSKDLNVYVDLTKSFDTPIAVPDSSLVGITIKGGTPEGSVYVDAITIDYTPGDSVKTESPLAWKYEKIEAKGTVNEGDVLMMYRSGNAAGDIDGMETSHYLDAIGVASTTNVDDPTVMLFTANQTSDGHWTLTNQYGQKLGARSAQNLAWDEGTTTWDITMGYDGATIASTNTKYGTMRFNAPSGSYARFWNYTSKTLQLPYLYRRAGQQQPVVSTGLALSATQRDVNISEQDTVVLKHQFVPKTVTDQRIVWQSSDEKVACVRSGIVELVGVGSATITATAVDGGSSATCLINVTGDTPSVTGDVNGDGQVDTSDLSELITIILNNGTIADYPRADVNGDGQIDTTDISVLIALILG